MSCVRPTCGNFRECRGDVCALRFMKDSEKFNYEKEVVMYSGYQGKYGNADPLLPQVKGRILKMLFLKLRMRLARLTSSRLHLMLAIMSSDIVL